jgi:hypothetical protein
MHPRPLKFYFNLAGGELLRSLKLERQDSTELPHTLWCLVGLHCHILWAQFILVELGYKLKAVVKHIWNRYRGTKLRSKRPSKSWIYKECAKTKQRGPGRPKKVGEQRGPKRRLTKEDLKFVVQLIKDKEANTSPEQRRSGMSSPLIRTTSSASWTISWLPAIASLQQTVTMFKNFHGRTKLWPY